MAVSRQVPYLIIYSNRSLYDAAVAAYGNTILKCPVNAAALLGLSYPSVTGPGGALPSPEGAVISFSTPWGDGLNVPPGTLVGGPPTLLDDTLDTQTFSGAGYTDSGGNAAEDFYTYIWAAALSYSGGGGVGGGGGIPPPTTPIPQRRWIDGAELPDLGAGGSAANGGGIKVSRDSSRTPDGLGFCFRDWSGVSRTHLTTENGGAAPKKSWERLYVRIRTLPSVATYFWRAGSTTQPAAGVRISVDPTGRLILERVDSFSVGTILGTSINLLNLNAWYRIDVLINVSADGVANGRVRFYLNGVLNVDAVITAAGSGFGLNTTHAASHLGPGASGNGLECDLDDWMSADIPELVGVESLASVDWLCGSHMQRLNANAFDASHSGNWAGDFRSLIQVPPLNATSTVTSSTSTARMAVTLGLGDGPTIRQQGCVALVVAIYNQIASGVINGQLGYNLGAGDVLATITETTSFAWKRTMYLPTGLLAPNPINPAILIHTKGASAVLDTVRTLVGEAEYIGSWGTEDTGLGAGFFTYAGVHNSTYHPNGTTSYFPPTGDVKLVSGTYTGNSLGQDLSWLLQANFLYIRPLTGATGGVRWHSSQIASHRGGQEAASAGLMVQALVEAQVPKTRISGADADANTTAVTYQYVAILDPAARYTLAGAFGHDTTLASAINTLADTGFTPIGVFVHLEVLSGGATARLFYRGPGHTGADVQNVATGVLVANALTMAMGSLTSQSPLHVTSMAQAAYLCLREASGGACGDPEWVFEITSYTGDGVSPRNIPLALGGNFPFLVMVIPHNAQGWVRDASHTGSNSSRIDNLSTNSTTAITAGAVDQITVGATLNTAGVVYEVFAIRGLVGSWGDGTVIPTLPCAPAGSQWLALPAPGVAGTGSACLVNLPTS